MSEAPGSGELTPGQVDKSGYDETNLEGEIADLLVARRNHANVFRLVGEQPNTDMPIPMSMDTGPAQFAYLVLKSRDWFSWPRRRNWSQKNTASQGAIQYAMISRKFSIFRRRNNFSI